MRSLAKPVIVCLALLASGCRGTTVDAIDIGMEFDEAAAALRGVGAEPTVLAMQPPERQDGTFLGLECFTMSEKAVLSITFDPRDDGRIVGLSLCDQMDQPRGDRVWRRVDSYPLR